MEKTGKTDNDEKSPLRKLENYLGLPSLTKVAESLDKFPDSKQLTLIKEVLESADRLSRRAGDLNAVISIIREINQIPIDKLVELDKILARIEKIVSKTPAELTNLLANLKEG